MTNLAIHTIIVPRQTAVLRLTKFLMKSLRVMYKRKRIDKFQRKGRKRKRKDKNIVIKEKIWNSKCEIQTF